jgi:hypothetical protein
MKYIYLICLVVIFISQNSCKDSKDHQVNIPQDKGTAHDRLYALQMNSDPYYFAVSKDSVMKYFQETDSVTPGTYVALMNKDKIFFKAAAVRNVSLKDTIVDYRDGNDQFEVPISMFLDKGFKTDSIVFLRSKRIYLPME